MAGTGIRFDFEGYDEIMDALKRASNKKLLDLSSFAAEEVLNASQDAFKEEADPATGRKWKPISTVSDQHKKRSSSKGKTLFDRGRLLKSLTYEAFSDGSFIVGSNLVYSRAHQEGYKERNLEARPFLGISDRLVRRILTDNAVREILEI